MIGSRMSERRGYPRAFLLNSGQNVRGSHASELRSRDGRWTAVRDRLETEQAQRDGGSPHHG